MGLGPRIAPRRAQPPDRPFDDDSADDDELTDRLLRGSPAPYRSSDQGQMPRVILTLGLTASVVVMVFLGVVLRLPPSDFAQYISPLTGIAGLALGYWFGSDRSR